MACVHVYWLKREVHAFRGTQCECFYSGLIVVLALHIGAAAKSAHPPLCINRGFQLFSDL